MLNFLHAALKPETPTNVHYVLPKPSPSVLIGSPDGWLNKHRNPPEIGRVVRVRYLDLVEGIAVRASDLQYTLTNGDPVSGVIEWRELEECEIRGNVVRN